MKLNNFTYTCYIVNYHLNITVNHNLDRLPILIKPLTKVIN